MRTLPTVAVLIVAACASRHQASDDSVDDSFEEASSALSAPSTAPPLTQQSGAWWNNHAMDPPSAQTNEVWAEVAGAVPDHQVKGSLTLTVTCHLPVVGGNTLQLHRMAAQVDSTTVVQWTPPAVAVDTPKTVTIATQNFSDGYHELRVRCFGEETQGPETGKITAVTNGFPVIFANGNATGSGQNSGTDYVDAHAWYANDIATGDFIGYVYAQLNGVHALTDAPIRGVVPINGRVRNSGATTIDHWMVMVDSTVIAMFHGTTQTYSISLDTTKFANGEHLLKFHGHGLARSGKQLAAQVMVKVTIQN